MTSSNESNRTGDQCAGRSESSQGGDLPPPGFGLMLLTAEEASRCLSISEAISGSSRPAETSRRSGLAAPFGMTWMISAPGSS